MCFIRFFWYTGFYLVICYLRIWGSSSGSDGDEEEDDGVEVANAESEGKGKDKGEHGGALEAWSPLEAKSLHCKHHPQHIEEGALAARIPSRILQKVCCRSSTPITDHVPLPRNVCEEHHEEEFLGDGEQLFPARNLSLVALCHGSKF